MELFLLIAIGLSLISFISLALTRTPAQTFSVHSYMSEEELPEDPADPSDALNEGSNTLKEEGHRKGSAGFLREDEMLAHQII